VLCSIDVSPEHPVYPPLLFVHPAHHPNLQPKSSIAAAVYIKQLQHRHWCGHPVLRYQTLRQEQAHQSQSTDCQRTLEQARCLVHGACKTSPVVVLLRVQKKGRAASRTTYMQGGRTKAKQSKAHRPSGTQPQGVYEAHSVPAHQQTRPVIHRPLHSKSSSFDTSHGLKQRSCDAV
jgi:hypothetical protein